MAFPVVQFDSTDGAASDTAASGAGPATALTGSSASTSGDGLTVTLDGSPDLSGVNTDGSHVIYLADSTAGNRNFGKITGKDDGADTVTVSDAFGTSLSGKSWAIGGVRASIDHADSRKLVENNNSTGDSGPGWVIEFKSGHSETVAGATLEVRSSGDTTDGPLIIRAESGAATMPVFTKSTDAYQWYTIGDYIEIDGIEVRNSAGTKSTAGGIRLNGNHSKARNCKAIDATHNHRLGIYCGGSNNLIENCEAAYCTESGLRAAGSTFTNRFFNCYAHDNTGVGVEIGRGGGSGMGHVFEDIISESNTSHGFQADVSGTNDDRWLLTLKNCTADNNGGDGIRCTGTATQLGSKVSIINSIFSNNTYGINFSGTGMDDTAYAALSGMISHVCTYNNSSGAINGLTTASIESHETSDPQYTDAANGDFSIGTNLKEKGFPGTGNIGYSSTRSHVDIGAAQRQEAGAGGGTVNLLRGKVA